MIRPAAHIDRAGGTPKPLKTEGSTDALRPDQIEPDGAGDGVRPGGAAEFALGGPQVLVHHWIGQHQPVGDLLGGETPACPEQAFALAR